MGRAGVVKLATSARARARAKSRPVRYPWFRRSGVNHTYNPAIKRKKERL